jgi:hypothetical protein
VPYYRITISLVALRASAEPAAVLSVTAAEVARIVTLEANDIQVARGEARLTVRSMGDDDAAAERVAGAIRARTDELMDLPRASIARRDGGAWTPI